VAIVPKTNGRIARDLPLNNHRASDFVLHSWGGRGKRRYHNKHERRGYPANKDWFSKTEGSGGGEKGLPKKGEPDKLKTTRGGEQAYSEKDRGDMPDDEW
jgi:hypothetical protein